MIENYEERISALEKVAEGALAEIRDLKAEIAESNKANVIKPLQFCEGETAWYVDAWGVVDHITPIGLPKIAKTNRLFKSPEMAEMFRQKSQLIADALYWKELFDREFTPDWGVLNETRYFIDWHIYDEKFCVKCSRVYRPFEVVFSTYEIAQSFADWLNSRKESEE